MWLCVVITFSAVSFFWFQSTASEFVALVNPEKAEQERIFAEQQDQEQLSLLANIGDQFEVLKAGFSELFGIGSDNTVQITNTYRASSVPPNLFPTSQNK